MEIISRKQALSKGMTRYFTGLPCLRGHLTHRKVSGWQCMECRKVKSAEYRSKEENRIRAKEVTYAWRRKNPERVVIQQRAHSSKRRRQCKASVRGFSFEDVQRTLSRQKRKCVYCKSSIGSAYHIDHIMPLALGGTNSQQNIQLLCQPCNQRKAASHPVLYANSIGLLV
jgi:5-methylcytosine-specific restriction endonuclease McrA